MLGLRNISDISGTVIVGGGNIYNTATGLSTAEVKQLFDQLYIAIEAFTKTSHADK